MLPQIILGIYLFIYLGKKMFTFRTFRTMHLYNKVQIQGASVISEQGQNSAILITSASRNRLS